MLLVRFIAYLNYMYDVMAEPKKYGIKLFGLDRLFSGALVYRIVDIVSVQFNTKQPFSCH